MVYDVLMRQLYGGKVAAVDLVPDMVQRAAAVLANSEQVGVHPYIKPRDIAAGNAKLNLAFLAQLFNDNPGLSLSLSLEHGVRVSHKVCGEFRRCVWSGCDRRCCGAVRKDARRRGYILVEFVESGRDRVCLGLRRSREYVWTRSPQETHALESTSGLSTKSDYRTLLETRYASREQVSNRSSRKSWRASVSSTSTTHRPASASRAFPTHRFGDFGVPSLAISSSQKPRERSSL